MNLCGHCCLWQPPLPSTVCVHTTTALTQPWRGCVLFPDSPPSLRNMFGNETIPVFKSHSCICTCEYAGVSVNWAAACSENQMVERCQVCSFTTWHIMCACVSNMTTASYRHTQLLLTPPSVAQPVEGLSMCCQTHFIFFHIKACLSTKTVPLLCFKEGSPPFAAKKDYHFTAKRLILALPRGFILHLP